LGTFCVSSCEQRGRQAATDRIPPSGWIAALAEPGVLEVGRRAKCDGCALEVSCKRVRAAGEDEMRDPRGGCPCFPTDSRRIAQAGKRLAAGVVTHGNEEWLGGWGFWGGENVMGRREAAEAGVHQTCCHQRPVVVRGRVREVAV